LLHKNGAAEYPWFVYQNISLHYGKKLSGTVFEKDNGCSSG
jgi:hypothetical protein